MYIYIYPLAYSRSIYVYIISEMVLDNTIYHGIMVYHDAQDIQYDNVQWDIWYNGIYDTMGYDHVQYMSGYIT